MYQQLETRHLSEGFGNAYVSIIRYQAEVLIRLPFGVTVTEKELYGNAKAHDDPVPAEDEDEEDAADPDKEDLHRRAEDALSSESAGEAEEAPALPRDIAAETLAEAREEESVAPNKQRIGLIDYGKAPPAFRKATCLCCAGDIQAGDWRWRYQTKLGSKASFTRFLHATCVHLLPRETRVRDINAVRFWKDAIDEGSPETEEQEALAMLSDCEHRLQGPAGSST